MTTYTVMVNNPLIDREIMRIETDDYGLARLEAAYLSTRHGIAGIYDNSSNVEVARFRYGVEVALNKESEGESDAQRED